MKKLITLAMALILALPALAQSQTSGIKDNDKDSALESAHWYIPLDYGGFEFEIPAGSVVKKDSKLLVTYPDASFGVSMENEAVGLNQKIAFEKVRSYATNYKLTDAKTEKVKIAGVAGAKATGKLENMDVTILILPLDDQQVTTVVMATPERSEWARHFIDSFKH